MESGLANYYSGTSGLLLPVRNKLFYPEDFKDKSRLCFYSSIMNSIEVNRKKHFLIGEEAVVDLTNFNLQGKKRKSLRNAINNLERNGYRSQCYRAPLSEAFIKQLRLVSDNWLVDMKRTERVFSQGMFDETKIRDSDIITLEDAEGKVLAFLNVIPSFAPREATYDLIRKLAGAPGGNMDVLLLRFMDYCREEGYQLLNMGLAPLSGYEKKAGF